MSNNLFLPEKKVIEVEHNLSVAGTYTWTAPDLNRDGSDYEIEVALYGGGGGTSLIQLTLGDESSSGTYGAGQGGGSGGYCLGILKITPLSTINFTVGSGGLGRINFPVGSGFSGQASFIELDSSEIVRANGGSGGSFSESIFNANSGSVVITNSNLYSNTISLSTLPRSNNGDSSTGIYYGPRTITNKIGGIGGQNLPSEINYRHGSDGRIIIRYKLKENITDNVPVLI